MEIIIIGLVAFFAAILTFFSGFGLGTILTPVMMVFFPVDIAVAFTGIVHFSNNIFKLFINGILIGSKDGYPGNVDWGSFSDNLILGSFDSGSGTNYFDGKIDEVRFWNIARTENEIKAYKNVG